MLPVSVGMAQPGRTAHGASRALRRRYGGGGGPLARVRTELWSEVRQFSGQGRALLAYSDGSEQGYSFETHDHEWHPVDHEGLTLIFRPKQGVRRPAQSAPPAKGWSKASKRRRFGGG